MSIFFVPSQVTFLFGILATIRYRRFYEFAISSFFLDALYRPRPDIIIGLFGIAVLCIILSDIFYEYMRVNKKDTL
jgi:hypothetical protein